MQAFWIYIAREYIHSFVLNILLVDCLYLLIFSDSLNVAHKNDQAVVHAVTWKEEIWFCNVTYINNTTYGVNDDPVVFVTACDAQTSERLSCFRSPNP